MDGRVGLLGGLMAAVALATCSVFAPTFDGWTVGALETCPEPNFDLLKGEDRPSTWDCEASLAMWLKAAGDGFDRRDPGHAAVTRTTLHEYAGHAQFLSNCCLVAVFELADGSVRAIGVAHLGVVYSQVSTVDYGPDK